MMSGKTNFWTSPLLNAPRTLCLGAWRGTTAWRPNTGNRRFFAHSRRGFAFGRGGMTDLSLVMFGVFLAASVPFVISILISLKPNLSYLTAEDYFLSRRELSVGDFIAATIGYSLQVSSIFLFFFCGI